LYIQINFLNKMNCQILKKSQLQELKSGANSKKSCHDTQGCLTSSTCQTET
jgi:hypothetical protein